MEELTIGVQQLVRWLFNNDFINPELVLKTNFKEDKKFEQHKNLYTFNWFSRDCISDFILLKSSTASSLSFSTLSNIDVTAFAGDGDLALDSCRRSRCISSVA